MHDLDGLQLQNFRAFKDTGYVEIRPLTVIIGRNSAGKSSLLRLFPLLSQSAATRTSSPLLWNGALVDFGEFGDVVFAHDKSSVVSLSFSFKPSNEPRLFLVENENYGITIELVSTSNDRTELRSISIIASDECQAEITFEQNKIQKVTINGADFPGIFRSHSISSAFLPVIMIDHRRQQLVHDTLLDTQWLFHGRTSRQKKIDVLANLPCGNRSILKARILEKCGNWTKRAIADIEIDALKMIRLQRRLFAHRLPEVAIYVNDALTELAENTAYKGPFRAPAQRFYRKQDLEVGSVDPKGENFAMFFDALGDASQKDFRNWTKKNFGFSINTKRLPGHVSIFIDDGRSKKQNLADVGFGYAQMLPLIAEIWQKNYQKRRFNRRSKQRITIEQPELHLHPALQAAMAKTITATVENNLADFIIETHSRTIIDAIAFEIEDGNLSSEKVQIFVVEPIAAGSSIRVVTINELGELENWPFGFFDAFLGD